MVQLHAMHWRHCHQPVAGYSHLCFSHPDCSHCHVLLREWWIEFNCPYRNGPVHCIDWHLNAHFFLGLNKVGGVEKLVASVPRDYWIIFKPSTDSVYPWHALILGYPVIGIWFWCTDQTIVQRTLAAKNVDHGQKGALLIAALKIVMPALFIVPGIMCLVLVNQGVFAPLTNPDHAYITMVYGLLPTGVIGLALGTLLVSIINDVATGLSSFSTVFAMDVYVKKIKPTATAAEINSIGKKIIVLAATVSVLMAILLSNSDKGLFDLGQSLITYLAPPASTVFIVGILWKRATPRAAELTLYVGTFLCLLIGFCQLTGFPTKRILAPLHAALFLHDVCIGRIHDCSFVHHQAAL